MSRELLKAYGEILKVRIKRASGDYSQTDEELIPALERPHSSVQPVSVGHAVVPREESTGSVKLSEVIEQYLIEVEKGGSWTNNTKNENLKIFELFIEIEGDLPVGRISARLMSAYKSKLMCIPPNINKMPEYRGMTVQEVINSKPEKTLSVSSVNKYLNRMSSLFKYAVKNGYMNLNPAEGMQIRKSKRPDEERPAYVLDDLEKIFHSEEYLSGKFKHAYCRWTPLIALYTGCRLEEICQLHLDDIRQEDGVCVFDINTRDGKQVKTTSSRRVIPIHPDILECGFLEYVNTLKSKGYERLFPELKKRPKGYGQDVSKWYRRYKERCGIEEGKTFHSFRHTFITHLKHKRVDNLMISELAGHANDSETFGRYAKPYPSDLLLREAIMKIDYGLRDIPSL